jgi:hypothetical protein
MGRWPRPVDADTAQWRNVQVRQFAVLDTAPVCGRRSCWRRARCRSLMRLPETVGCRNGRRRGSAADAGAVVGLGNDLVEAGFVPDSGPPSAAAGEHYAAAERLLAALPLARRGAERDRRIAACAGSCPPRDRRGSPRQRRVADNCPRQGPESRPLPLRSCRVGCGSCSTSAPSV